MIRAQTLVLTVALLFKEAIVKKNQSGSETSTEQAGKNVGGSQVHELKTS